MNHDLLLYWSEFLGLSLFSVGDSKVSVGSLLLGSTYVVGIWWLAGLLERSLQRVALRRNEEPWKNARVHTLARIARYVVWAVGTMLGLNSLGIDLSSIALLGSALAVGLGFGLQNVFANFISGIVLLLEHSLKVGDVVELPSGVRGNVREIALRYTHVTTNDGLDVLVPNSEFVNGQVVNWTLSDAFRRMHVPFGVAYGTPKELVREAGLAAARSVSGIVESDKMKTDVWLLSYGDNAVNYELVVWADRALTERAGVAHAKLMWALDEELARRGIEIPFPQRDLHVRSGTLNVRMMESAPEPGASQT